MSARSVGERWKAVSNGRYRLILCSLLKVLDDYT